MDEAQIMLIEIKSDLESIRADVTWLKRLFGGVVIFTGMVFGIDVTGLV